MNETSAYAARAKRSPMVWGTAVKANMSRALAGISLGLDAVCIDTHLRKRNFSGHDACHQRAEWFRCYGQVRGFAKAIQAVKWHIEWLDQIKE